MKTRTLISTVVVMGVMGAGISSCGADPVSVVSILLITNTWAEVGDPTHEFDLDADPPSSVATDHGAFVGVETENGQNFNLTGNWANGQIQFTVERPGNHLATYSGAFPNDPDTLWLNSAVEGQLVIFRNR